MPQSAQIQTCVHVSIPFQVFEDSQITDHVILNSQIEYQMVLEDLQIVLLSFCLLEKT